MQDTQTPLLHAVVDDNTDAVKLLLKHGAHDSVNMADDVNLYNYSNAKPKLTYNYNYRKAIHLCLVQ
jgi:ankyrin repeat protein